MPTDFQLRVYDLVRRVPAGRVTTYKILAEKLGTRAYRAVGSALRQNPFAPEVPCHRVVSADGSIGGFCGTNDSKSDEVKRKISMLKKEGVSVSGNKIEGFSEKVWG